MNQRQGKQAGGNLLQCRIGLYGHGARSSRAVARPVVCAGYLRQKAGVTRTSSGNSSKRPRIIASVQIQVWNPFKLA